MVQRQDDHAGQPERTAVPALETHCPVAATLQLIGGRYKGLILWNLMDGPLRFSALRRAVPCATPKMLTQQLRELEADGLISRTVYPVVPPKVEYALTRLGRSLCPVLEAMRAWGGAYLARQNPHGVKGMDEKISGRPPWEGLSARKPISEAQKS